MTGSEKQVKWAEEIKVNKIESLKSITEKDMKILGYTQEDIEKTIKYINQIEDAKVVIEQTRHASKFDLIDTAKTEMVQDDEIETLKSKIEEDEKIMKRVSKIKEGKEESYVETTTELISGRLNVNRIIAKRVLNKLV